MHPSSTASHRGLFVPILELLFFISLFCDIAVDCSHQATNDPCGTSLPNGTKASLKSRYRYHHHPRPRPSAFLSATRGPLCKTSARGESTKGENRPIITTTSQKRTRTASRTATRSKNDIGAGIMRTKFENESPAVRSLITAAKLLHEAAFSDGTAGESDDGDDGTPVTTTSSDSPNKCAVAPGRVNLIGEHTDYTGGFVLPLAISYSTAVYGSGSIVDAAEGACQITSVAREGQVVRFASGRDMKPFLEKDESWANYVMGVVAKYMEKDVPDGKAVRLNMAVAGDVPLGGGLSSSASLEIAAARFLETFVPSSSSRGEDEKATAKERALRGRWAENTFCNSPCGIMDQFVISASKRGKLLLIDCTSVDYTEVTMGGGDKGVDELPVIVITNSNVTHSISGGGYSTRVKECEKATEGLQKVNPDIKTLRDATMEDVDKAKEHMSEVIYRRAKHVVTENARVLETRDALESADWKKVGELMYASHASMRDDYETSCAEIDILVDLAKSFPGVYGSRLTGGGFGGCTVTLVRKEKVGPLIQHLKKEYKEKTGKECDCIETLPADGAREVEI